MSTLLTSSEQCQLLLYSREKAQETQQLNQLPSRTFCERWLLYCFICFELPETFTVRLKGPLNITENMLIYFLVMSCSLVDLCILYYRNVVNSFCCLPYLHFHSLKFTKICSVFWFRFSCCVLFILLINWQKHFDETFKSKHALQNRK